MGHYDECRPGYCPGCGAGPGNIKNGVCEFCGPKKKSKERSVTKHPLLGAPYERYANAMNAAKKAKEPASMTISQAVEIARKHAPEDIIKRRAIPDWVVNAILEASRGR